MAKQIVEFKDGDVSVFVETNDIVEVSEPEEATDSQEHFDDMVPASVPSFVENATKKVASSVIGAADQTLSKAMGVISYTSNTVLAEIDNIKKKPSTVEVQFGIKIDGKGKAVVASGGAEVNYTVKLSWQTGE